MLPLPPPNIFLCSPLGPNTNCTAYHTTAAESVAHILATHADIAAYIAAHGRLRVHSLPLAVSVHAAGANGTPVWFCACCERYHPTEAALLQHLQQTGSAAAILDLAGQNGLDRYTRVRCQRVLVIVANEDNEQDAAVDAAVAVAVVEAQPVVQPVVQGGFNVRVHFSFPYVRGSVLVFLPAPSIAAFTAAIAPAYAGMTGADEVVVDWADRFRTGVPVRIAFRGGALERRVVQGDADLVRDFEMVEAMEAFLGDRREHGGISTRG